MESKLTRKSIQNLLPVHSAGDFQIGSLDFESMTLTVWSDDRELVLPIGEHILDRVMYAISADSSVWASMKRAADKEMKVAKTKRGNKIRKGRKAADISKLKAEAELQEALTGIPVGYIPLATLAQRLNVSIATINRWRRDKKLKAVKNGRSYYCEPITSKP